MRTALNVLSPVRTQEKVQMELSSQGHLVREWDNARKLKDRLAKLFSRDLFGALLLAIMYGQSRVIGRREGRRHEALIYC